VLNCDGVDDVGSIQVMFSDGRPDRVLDAVARASRISGVAHHPRRLALGVLTDSVAFTEAGIASVTFSRGSLRSLARVHSRRDDLAHLRGSGIPETAVLMAASARALATGDQG
jgi:Zn-dependent M28 family amino/carboxypeptidase